MRMVGVGGEQFNADSAEQTIEGGDRSILFNDYSAKPESSRCPQFMTIFIIDRKGANSAPKSPAATPLCLGAGDSLGSGGGDHSSGNSRGNAGIKDRGDNVILGQIAVGD